MATNDTPSYISVLLHNRIDNKLIWCLIHVSKRDQYKLILCAYALVRSLQARWVYTYECDTRLATSPPRSFVSVSVSRGTRNATVHPHLYFLRAYIHARTTWWTRACEARGMSRACINKMKLMPSCTRWLEGSATFIFI